MFAFWSAIQLMNLFPCNIGCLSLIFPAKNILYNGGKAGLPCKPYSIQRAKRFAHGSVKKHDNYKTMFVDFFKWLDFHAPRAAEKGCSENLLRRAAEKSC